jgi:CDP-paratose 2-epimerase
MKYLITGGCGFLGSNLANEVLRRGEELFIFDNLFREGSHHNLQWLKEQGKFKFYQSDIRNINDVEYAIKDSMPDVIFHLAGQVAMTTSLANPRLDFEINVLGGNNLLETVRKYCPSAIVTYSSTNKVYGDLEWISYTETSTRYIAEGFEKGFDENIPLQFQSPYGCSKGATDQYMLDYAKMFGLRTLVFRHSSIFGGRQFSTFDQGWVGWFIRKALDIKTGLSKEPFSISGSGKQVRDILFVPDLIGCYFNAVKNINLTIGGVFNIGGGSENSLSLMELFSFLEGRLDIKMSYTTLDWRQSDQKVFIADIQKAESSFGWKPSYSKIVGINEMIEWIGSAD